MMLIYARRTNNINDLDPVKISSAWRNLIEDYCMVPNREPKDNEGGTTAHHNSLSGS